MTPEYEKKLAISYEWAYRAPEGRFLLQHFIRSCGFFNVAGTHDAALVNQGQRAIGLALLAEIGALRNGEAISKQIFNDLLTVDKDDSDVPEYDPTAI